MGAYSGVGSCSVCPAPTLEPHTECCLLNGTPPSRGAQFPARPADNFCLPPAAIASQRSMAGSRLTRRSNHRHSTRRATMRPTSPAAVSRSASTRATRPICGANWAGASTGCCCSTPTPRSPCARVAWAHDWISDPSLAPIFHTLPSASVIVNGATPAKNSALTSAGAELRLANGVTLLGKFDGEFA
jgi:hypothetical protein